jgi:uncharacterized protein YkwD
VAASRSWLVGAAVGVLVLLSSCAPSGVAAPTAEARIAALVNQERAHAGLAPLAANPVLAQAAESYAADMAAEDFFSHTGADGSDHIRRTEAAGYVDWSFLGENLAAGQPTPERVVAAWMKSPTHRANVLAPDAREIGIGHAAVSGRAYDDYWAMETGARA